MLIRFACEKCGSSLEIEASAGGGENECPTCHSRLIVPRQGPGPGVTIGGFRIEKLLGRGGMGEVYLAEQISLGRRVALKILPPAFKHDRENAQRFLTEVRLLAQLEHPNIVTAYEAGEDDDVLYLAMTYIPGDSLEAWLKKQGSFGEREALTVVRPLAQALAYAWNSHRLLHRDIKPSNILLDAHGEPKLVDFGLAKSLEGAVGGLTLSNTLMGSPNYMSPEQADAAGDLDCRTDMYSLGATLYHMLTGTVPFASSSLMLTLKKQATESLPDPRENNPAVSRQTVDLLQIMLARDRAERHTAWETVSGDIERVLTGKSPSVVVPAPGRSVLLPARRPAAAGTAEASKPVSPLTLAKPPRSSWLVSAAVAGVLLAGLLVGIALRGRHGEVEATRPAAAAATKAETAIAPESIRPPASADMATAQQLAATKENAIQDEVAELSRVVNTAVAKGEFAAAMARVEKYAGAFTSETAIVRSQLAELIRAKQLAAAQARPGPAAESQIMERKGPPAIDLGGGAILELAWIPPGEFIMGSPATGPGGDPEDPQHPVRIGKGFWMGKYEVTQAQWERVMGNNPSQFKNAGPTAPVENVSWNDCQEFLRKLNQRPEVRERQFQARLPTEAEWEYARRAGTLTRGNPGGEDDDLDHEGWHRGNSAKSTHPVGQKQANAWGLCDMAGNVSEWCQDWSGKYDRGPATDPTGPSSGATHVVRGGSWIDPVMNCRPTFRDHRTSIDACCYVGLRVVSSHAEFSASAGSRPVEAERSTPSSGPAMAEDQLPPEVRLILHNMRPPLGPAGGGTVVAGQVLKEDGKPVSRDEIFISTGSGAPLSRTYDGGWFVYRIRDRRSPAGAVKLLAGSFYYETATVYPAVTEGKIPYTVVTVKRPSPQSMCHLYGRVTDEKGAPLEGASVTLECDLTGGWSAGPRVLTDNDGKYEIRDLAPRDYTVCVYPPREGRKYERDWQRVSPTPGARCQVDLKLARSKKVTLDYAFQADGSRSFQGRDVRTGTIVFQRPCFGIIFAEGRAHNMGGISDDLRLEGRNGQLVFRNFMTNGTAGFYDAGAVSLASLTEAGAEGYATRERPCLVDHAYVVRTYDGHFAKFVVRTIVDDDP